MMKASFILETGMIPPTIGIKKFNPDIDFHGDRIKVVREPTPFPKNCKKRISLNAFGYGGAVSPSLIGLAQHKTS